MSAKVASPPDMQQNLVPASGRFDLKEDSSGKVFLDFIYNNPNADRDRRRRKGNDGNTKKDSELKYCENQPMKNRGRTNHTKSPRPPIKRSENHTSVTLADIKSVALDMLSEVEIVSETFEGMSGKEEFDNFLLHLLTYFNCFFEKLHQEHKQNTSTYMKDSSTKVREPSLSEKQAYADSLVKLTVAEKYLGQAYCILVLGLGLQDQHHMSCGASRVSSTDKDRAMFETLYSFCTFVVWITFRRKDYEAVKKEIGRMLRSDTFNPAIRVKNAPEEKETEKKEEKTEGGKKEIKMENKITPAEYRRLHPKRPAIKSIIHQRSPAVVAILPSPKEEAHWLFKRTRPLSPKSLGKVGHEDDDEKQKVKPMLKINKDKFKMGILGEPLSQFNPVSLSPLGQENEDEEIEGEEGQKQGDESAGEQGTTADHGMSRTQTAVSEAVTVAYADD